MFPSFMLASYTVRDTTIYLASDNDTSLISVGDVLILYQLQIRYGVNAAPEPVSGWTNILNGHFYAVQGGTGGSAGYRISWKIAEASDIGSNPGGVSRHKVFALRAYDNKPLSVEVLTAGTFATEYDKPPVAFVYTGGAAAAFVTPAPPSGTLNAGTKSAHFGQRMTGQTAGDNPTTFYAAVSGCVWEGDFHPDSVTGTNASGMTGRFIKIKGA